MAAGAVLEHPGDRPVEFAAVEHVVVIRVEHVEEFLERPAGFVAVDPIRTDAPPGEDIADKNLLPRLPSLADVVSGRRR